MEQQRTEFYREIVRLAAASAEDITKQYPLGLSIPQKKVESWMSRFNHAARIPTKRDTPRLINSFKLGADPEFIFQNRAGNRIPATALALKTGIAFGADQNGRLVELRPKAYRSALKVMASILQELRWLTIVCPATQGYSWLCGAFMFGDGIGGHVHFGRKRATRDQEVEALANVMAALTQTGVYKAEDVATRMRGDERGQMYGRLDDFRLQNHGYEYRAFPSWLDSPWTAYLTLVISKLAVYDPGIVASWVDYAKTTEQWGVALKNLLMLYRGRDDDAELALWTLQQRGLPKHVGGDFKERWGLAGLTGPTVEVIPPSIGASPEAVEEIWTHLVSGAPLTANRPQLNWSPSSVPSGFVMVNNQEIHRYKGYGELVWDMCIPKRYSLSFANCEAPMDLTVSRALANELPANWLQRARVAFPQANIGVLGYDDRRIYTGPGLRTPRMASMTRKFLLSGLFPIWSVKTATPDAFTQWQEMARIPQGEERRLDGTVLYNSQL
jgi:hypothetical protein